MSQASKQPQSGWPAISGGDATDGFVRAVVSDGAGGWIVGGSFETVGGRACPRLARLTRERVLDTRFCLAPDDDVQALAVTSDTLFVGGHFRRVGGERRVRLAGVDLRSGRLLSWRADVTGRPFDDRGDLLYPSVEALAVHRGTLYLGGSLVERVGGVPRAGLAALDARTARIRPWRADASGDVYRLTVGREALYASGTFSRLAGKPAEGIGAVALRTGDRTRWSPPHSDRGSRPIAYADGVVYLAGRRLVAVDAATGAPLVGFVAPAFDGDVNGLAIDDDWLYAGGDFSRAGGAERSNLAVFSRRDGRLLPWAPRANADVFALAATENTIAVGGTLTSIGGVRRFGLVAIDGVTGRLLPWAPRLNGSANALAVVGSRLYVGGSFKRVNSEPRGGLAAFELDTLELSTWAPTLAPHDPFFHVGALAGEKDTIVVAGEFTSANGEPRERLAAFDATSGTLKDWNPGMSNAANQDGASDVIALAFAYGTVYLGGDFTRVGGVAREGFAELDAESGDVEPWQPRQDGLYGISALLRVDDVLYIGGDFDRFQGRSRRGLAAVDAKTYELLPWSPRLGAGWVGTQANDVEAVGARLVAVVGDFRTAEGAPHAAVALATGGSGRVLPWRPPASESAEFEGDAVAASEAILAFDGSVGGNADSISVYRLTRPRPETHGVNGSLKTPWTSDLRSSLRSLAAERRRACVVVC